MVIESRGIGVQSRDEILCEFVTQFDTAFSVERLRQEQYEILMQKQRENLCRCDSLAIIRLENKHRQNYFSLKKKKNVDYGKEVFQYLVQITKYLTRIETFRTLRLQIDKIFVLNN